MGLLSPFKRKTDSVAHESQTLPADEPGDGIQRARTRARQRLIGAAVLVTLGIIGFPLVFETQPRPIAVDIPIEIPAKDGGRALPMPPPRAAVAPPPPPPSAGSVPEPKPNDVITESRADAGLEPREAAPQAAEADASRAAPSAPGAPAKPATPARPVAPIPGAPDSKPALASAEAARAKALLEGGGAGGAPTPSSAARFVVQVGAFVDASAARETRLKAEKLGLKTYTQVADTANGSRIRVRVGPFANRDEADKARAKALTAGLSAVVLTL